MTEPVTFRTAKRWPPAKGGLWWDRDGTYHRIVVIEYIDGLPHSVVTEEHWDHSGKPWFRPGRDRATGMCVEYWDFAWSKRDRTLYCHKSGSGGAYLEHMIHRFAEPDPPPGQIWIADDVRLYRWISSKRPRVFFRPDRMRDELLKRGYRLLDRPLVVPGSRSRNPFAVAEEPSGHLVYCKVCDDWFPFEDECEHMEWCDKCACLVYVENHVREDSHDGKPIIHDDDEEGD